MDITNNHTLYLWTNHLDEEECISLFKDSLELLYKEHAIDFRKTFFFLRIINNTILDNRQCNYGYLHVEDERLFHLILGRNMDGTRREKYASISDIFPLDPLPTTFDVLDEDAKFDFLESFYKNGWTELNNDKSWELYETKIIQKQESLFRFVTGNIHVEPALVKAVDELYCPNAIISHNIPNEISVDDIKSYFSRFCTRPKNKKEDFPNVIQLKGKIRTVIVCFNPNTCDASFILLINKPAIIKNHSIRFYYAKKSDMRNVYGRY